MKYLKELQIFFNENKGFNIIKNYNIFIINFYNTFEFYLLPCIILNKGFTRKVNNKEIKTKQEISFRIFKFCLALYFKK